MILGLDPKLLMDFGIIGPKLLIDFKFGTLPKITMDFGIIGPKLLIDFGTQPKITNGFWDYCPKYIN